MKYYTFFLFKDSIQGLALRMHVIVLKLEILTVGDRKILWRKYISCPNIRLKIKRKCPIWGQHNPTQSYYIPFFICKQEGVDVVDFLLTHTYITELGTTTLQTGLRTRLSHHLCCVCKFSGKNSDSE